MDWAPSDANCSDGLSRVGAREPWGLEHGLEPAALGLPPWLDRLTGSWGHYLELLHARLLA